MEKKREGDREAAGEVFLSSDPLYHCFFGRYITVFFGIGDEKGEPLKLLLYVRLDQLARRKIGQRLTSGCQNIPGLLVFESRRPTSPLTASLVPRPAGGGNPPLSPSCSCSSLPWSRPPTAARPVRTSECLCGSPARAWSVKRRHFVSPAVEMSRFIFLSPPFAAHP
jgi:hypothetical protein